jgi:hypothetical protein
LLYYGKRHYEKNPAKGGATARECRGAGAERLGGGTSGSTRHDPHEDAHRRAYPRGESGDQTDVMKEPKSAPLALHSGQAGSPLSAGLTDGYALKRTGRALLVC